VGWTWPGPRAKDLPACPSSLQSDSEHPAALWRARMLKAHSNSAIRNYVTFEQLIDALKKIIPCFGL
jgi:hypothetical protein